MNHLSMAKFLFTGMLAGFGFGVAPAQEQTIPLRWSAATSVEYSSGDYDDEVDTDILFVAQTLSFERGPDTFRVTVPWLNIEGPADVISGSSADAEEGASRSVSGIGDLQFSLSHRMWNHGTSFFLTPSINAKAPTADEDKRLGSGEWDYWVRLLGMWSLGERSTAYASGGYRWMGSNEDFPLEDRALAGAGLYRQFGRLGAGLSYDFQQSSVESFDDQHEVGAYLSTYLRKSLRASLYSRTGFTDGSPDYAVGLNLGWRP